MPLTLNNSVPSVGFVSLGCPKALVDSELILTQLQLRGYKTVNRYHNADIVVINTCGFIDAAKKESIETIGEALAENGKVIVTGCMGANAEQITDIHPNVLHVSGPNSHKEVVQVIQKHVPYQKPHRPFEDLVPKAGVKLTPPHYAYLKISEGCNHGCTFCIIPSLRGKLQSRAPATLIKEAHTLLDSGVQELLIISQDTSAYGVDQKYKTTFTNGKPIKGDLLSLLNAIAEHDKKPWVRLHYVYPYPHVSKLIPLMCEQKIVPYLDIPLQHSSPTILKAMRRPGNIDNTLQQLQNWRAQCPELTLRSTFIVGFPGETDEDFAHLLAFLSQAQLDRVGAFTYSPVDGAKANALAQHIPEDIKAQRLEQLMLHQADISAKKLAKKIDTELDVIIDEVTDQQIIARSKADAPEIDGAVYIDIHQNTTLKPGDFIKTKIIDSDTHDLWGKLLTQ